MLKQRWKTPTGKKATHLLLDGGTMYVDDAQHARFLNEYANAVARGESLHVVETRTPVFRLFMDFDFKPVPPPHIIEAGVKSACSVAHYYFDASSRAVVLRKTIDAPDKVGVHVTWDAIFVDVSLATAFRAHLVAKLEAAAPEYEWNEIVDASVYAGSGLRMPWSSKRAVPGVYVPSSTCDFEGVVVSVEAPSTASEIRDWIRATCIRAPGVSTTPSCVVTSKPQSEAQSEESITHPRADLAAHAPALAAIHATLPAAYAAQTFTGMHRVGETCVVLRSDSRTCGNKAFEQHAHSTVYFVVLKRGYAYQRCYCRKDVVRDGEVVRGNISGGGEVRGSISGGGEVRQGEVVRGSISGGGGGVTCTDYASDPWPIPKAAIELLWPTPSETSSALMAFLDRTRPALKTKRQKRG